MKPDCRPSNAPQPLLPPHGGYAKLAAFKKSEVVYQGTLLFCRRFLPPRGDRTVDQMVQAARSCKQNLAEGSATSGTSKESELRLTGVARASLDELLEDYRDYLAARGFAEWGISHPRKKRLRAWCHSLNLWSDYKDILGSCSPEVFCNVMICVSHQAGTLIDGMLRRQEREYQDHGGVKERLAAARQTLRGSKWDDGAFKWLQASPNPTTLAAREAEAHRQISDIVRRIRRIRGWE